MYACMHACTHMYLLLGVLWFFCDSVIFLLSRMGFLVVLGFRFTGWVICLGVL